jgi:hypothetical protein
VKLYLICNNSGIYPKPASVYEDFDESARSVRIVSS